MFRLTDEYSLFYLRFIEPAALAGTDDWNLFSQTQAYKTWIQKGTTLEKGAQIDLVIDRNDHVVNLCEIKFHHEPFPRQPDAG